MVTIFHLKHCLSKSDQLLPYAQHPEQLLAARSKSKRYCHDLTARLGFRHFVMVLCSLLLIVPLYPQSAISSQKDKAEAALAKEGGYYQKLADGLQLLADKGYSPACLELADMYIKGDAIPRNVNKAIELLKKPTDINMLEAQFKIADLYRSEKNYQEAINLYQTLSSMNLPNSSLGDRYSPNMAAMKLAVMHKNGEGVSQDLSKALSLYRKAISWTPDASVSSSGPAKSKDRLDNSSANKQNSGIHKFNAEYRQLLKDLADQGYTNANFEYADNLWFEVLFRIIGPPPVSLDTPRPPRRDRSKGLDADEKEVIKYYQRAAEKGNIAAQENLAHACKVMKEWDCAIKWSNQAANMGSVKALLGLAEMYGGNGFWRGAPVDHRKSLELFRKASETGDGQAEYQYGSQFFSGGIAPSDERKALLLYHQAVANGSEAACEELARRYEEGDEAPRDTSKALIHQLRLFDLTRDGEENLKKQGFIYTWLAGDEIVIGTANKDGVYCFRNLVVYGRGTELVFTQKLLSQKKNTSSEIDPKHILRLNTNRPFFIVGRMQSNVSGPGLAEISLDGEDETWWISLNDVKIAAK